MAKGLQGVALIGREFQQAMRPDIVEKLALSAIQAYRQHEKVWSTRTQTLLVSHI